MSDLPRASDRIELHGWDAGACAWHGPDELDYSLAGSRNLVRKLHQLPGSWYGTLQGRCPGEPAIPFAVSIQDLGDAGLGMIDLEGSPGGPANIVLVVPTQRRATLRPEFAFEFTSFIKFLGGSAAAGSESVMYDYMQQVLDTPAESSTLVFSVETPHAAPELKVHFAQSAETLAMSIIALMAERDGVSRSAAATAPKRRGSPSMYSPGSPSAVFGRSDRSASPNRSEYRG